MKYLSGIFALNLMCKLDTYGDWHTSAIDWKKLRFWESNNSIFGDYGIEKNRIIPENDGKFNVANHIRALLDLISVGDFPTAQGMRDNFICNDKYTPEIFNKVIMLKKQNNWAAIDKFMGQEYMMQWINYKRRYTMNNFDRKKHGQVINEFLSELNSIEKDNFILKGGTALLTCYGLDRFSEDIDLDGTKRNIKEFVNKFCMKYGYSYQLANDTNTVERAFINYGEDKLLKVEVSYRKRIIPKEQYTKINGIHVYTIDMLCIMKTNAYMRTDKLRNLYDLCFIGDTYYNQLASSIKIGLQNTLEYKGLEQINYIIQNQEDTLINKDKLAKKVLTLYDKLDLLYDKDEQKYILFLQTISKNRFERR